MQDFKAAYINELIKMRHKSKIIVGAVLSLVAAVVWQLALAVLGNVLPISLAGDGSLFSLSVLNFFSATLLPLFSVFVVIDSFNGEIAANTMKQTLVRPLNRIGIYLSKAAAVGTFVFCSLMFMMVSTTIIGALFQMGVSFTLIGAWRVLLAYVVTWMPVMVFLLLIMVIAQFSRNGILTFFLSVFIYLGLQAVRFFYPALSNLLIVPLFDWYVGWIADVNNFGALLRQLSILLGSGLALFGFGSRIFETRDY